MPPWRRQRHGVDQYRYQTGALRRPFTSVGTDLCQVLTQPIGCHILLQPISCYLWEVAVGFPDRIERSLELAHPPAKVWAALTTPEGLSAWFGQEATIDLRPGGAAAMTFHSGLRVEMRVERVEEPVVFGFTWRLPDLPEHDPRRTYVEFTLEEVGAGSRLRVVETGFAQLPDDSRQKTQDSHAEGWARELDELAGYLDAA